VAVVDELPKGPTGKILKRAIDPAALKAETKEAAPGSADTADTSDTSEASHASGPGNCTPSGGR
jgi:hypothetical protein